MRKISNVFFSAVLGFIMASVTGVLMLAPIVAILLLFVVNHLPKGILAMSAPAGDDPSELEKRFENKLTSLLHNFKSGIITAEAFELRMTALAKDIETRGLKNTELETRISAFQKTIDALEKTIDKLGEDAKAQLQSRSEGESLSTILLRDVFSKPEFTTFANSGAAGSQSFQTRLSITSDYTGTNLITKQIQTPTIVPERLSSIRALLAMMGCIVPTTLSNIVAPEVYAIDDNTSVAAENGSLTGITFKVKENTWNVKRIGNYVSSISKRMLKDVPFISSYISSLLPRRISWVEDSQILKGDNVGNNMQGFIGKVPAFTMSGPSFVAGKVASIATYSAGTKVQVNFAADHGLINGYKITFANATASKYNTTFVIQILNTKSIILDVSYTAEADTSAWTATTKNPLYLGVDNANELDVLTVALNLAVIAEYVPNALIMHPSVATKLATLKCAVEYDYLNLTGKVERRNGVLYIAGFPVVETTAMPMNEFLVGYFAPDTVMLAPFTPLEIVTAADVADIKAGTINVIAQEEFIFAILNPYVFLSGEFTAAKALLETA